MSSNTQSASYEPKYKICVSGTADMASFPENTFAIAEELGREIARRDCVLVEGATTGFPFWAAKGAKEAGGIVVGFSPAASEREHRETYKLPTDYRDIIVYTGFNYSGRNLLLTRAADAVIVGCGRIGTINEFTIAFEDKKPIGVLQGDWSTDEMIEEILKQSHRAEERAGEIIFSKNPKELVGALIELVQKRKNFHLAL